MLLKFSFLYIAYILKDLVKNLYVVYFEIKPPFSCHFMEFIVFTFTP
jgi:hypothetical protein